MNYVDYDFYLNTYHGELDQDLLDRIVVKASAHVRRITFGRADQYTEDENVKLATCAVCDVIGAFDSRMKLHNGLNVSSESTDGYSISYVNEQLAGESAEAMLSRKIYQAAEVYLLPTGLLNWGVYDDDKCGYYDL